MAGQRPNLNSQPSGPLDPGNVWAWSSQSGWVQRPNPFPERAASPQPQFGAIGQSLLANDAAIGPAPKQVVGVMPSAEGAIRTLVNKTTGYDSPLLGLSLKNPLKKPQDALKFMGNAPKYAGELYSLWSGGPVQGAR